jgi:hypothetical protein
VTVQEALLEQITVLVEVVVQLAFLVTVAVAQDGTVDIVAQAASVLYVLFGDPVVHSLQH